ncbi:hypothetical protein GGI43DRAFT_263683 [Trichoderma evansii]
MCCWVIISSILAHDRVNVDFDYHRARRHKHCRPVVTLILTHDRVNSDFEYYLTGCRIHASYEHSCQNHINSRLSKPTTKWPINRLQCPLFTSTAKPIIVDWGFCPCFPRLRQFNKHNNILFDCAWGASNSDPQA